MKSRSAFTTLRSRLQLLIEEAMHRYRRESEPHRFRAAQRALRLSRLEERILMSASPMIVIAQVAALDVAAADAGAPETIPSAGPTADPAAADTISEESAVNSQADVFIAETHSLTLSAGSECESQIPECLPDSSLTIVVPEQQNGPVELIVVDSRVEHYSELLNHLSQSESGRSAILVLSDSTDGVQQITEWLEQSAVPMNHFSAIHFVSHGSEGSFQLGSSVLTADSLTNYSEEFTLWQSYLTADADLLIYGCDVTSDASGLRLLEVLSDLTNADVAASSDMTGNEQLGGDWELESVQGTVESTVFVAVSGQQSWAYTLELNPAGPIQVNATTQHEQSTSASLRGSRNAVALDDNGNYVVTWTSTNQDAGGLGVYARRFDKNGNALTGEIAVNTTTANDQYWSSVAADASGNFVVTWTSNIDTNSSNQGVFARMFSASGTALTDEFRVNGTTSGDQRNSTISMNRAGQFVIAWQGEGTGDTTGVFFRRYSATGTALDAAERKANTTNAGEQISPAVTIDAAGRTVVFWEVDKHLYFQRYDSNGTAAGSERQLDTMLSDSSGLAAAVDGNGDFTAVYRAETVLPGIWGRSYAADGSLKRDFFAIALGDATSPSIAMATDGSFLVTFEESGDGDATGVFAQRYNANGSVNGGQFQVNQYTTGEQQSASAAMTSAIDYVVVWSGESAADPTGVYARQYGNAVPTITSIANQTIAEDTSTGALTFTISDLESAASALTVTASSGNTTLVSPGGIVISGTGASRTVTVTPAANQNGTTQITLTVSDGLESSSTTFQLTVTAVSDPPSAVADSFTLNEDSTLNIPAVSGLLTNDSDADGNSISILDSTRPANGTASVTSNGALTYTPTANFFGTDSIQYLLSDGTSGRSHYWKLDGSAADSVGTSNGTVTGPTTTTGRWGQALQFDGVNDYVQIPDFTYTSEMTVSFWFRVADNSGTGYQYLYSHGSTGTANSLNVFLIEQSTPAVTANNVLRTRILDSNDADNVSGLDINVNTLGLIDNQWHQYTLTTQTGVGTRVYIDGVQRAAISSGGNSINPTGSLYLGARNDLASSRFAHAAMDTVQVFDRRLDATEVSSLYSGGTSVATATFTVTAVNDAPVVATNSSGIIAEGGTLTIGSSLLNVTDVDQSASQITYSLATAPGNGQLRLSGTTLTTGNTWTQDDVNSGRLTYVHDGSETASDLMRFGISDGAGGSITSTTFNFSITPVNDAPVLAAATPSLGNIFTGETSTPVTVASFLGATVSDADSGASSGIAVISAAGSGTWQYSLNGTSWSSFGTVSSTQALLLRHTDRIRYVTGTVAETPTFTYRAWDQTGTSAGLQGSKFNTTTTGTGGSSPFSSSSNTASMTVTVPNAAPVGVADNYRLAEDSTLTSVNRPGWFDGRWTARQQITLNNAAGSLLTDTAVLVTVSSSTIDYGQTQNSGQDLRFVDRDGTLLSYEIEEWNESGISRVWVRVPQIDAASNADFFWMYYGNASATAGQNAASVWTSQARAIVHMTGTPSDSSALANEVDLSGTAATAGYIAGARNFNGTSDEISLGSDVDNVFSGGGTVSAWIRPTGWGENNFGRIASKASSTFSGGALGNGWAFELDGTTGSILFENGFSGSTGQWRTAASTITLNTWQHVAVTYDSSSTSSNPKIFINGAEVAVTEIRTPSGSVTSDAALDLKIGNHSAASTRTFDGAIDEFRVWSGARSAAQILADYRSATGALITIGAAESGPGGVLGNDTDAESNPLTASLVTGPTQSQSFTLNSNGTFTYTPLANFFGTDTFTYQVSDGTSTTGPVTVSIVVNPVNDLPVITSNGGAATATFDVAENTTAVTTVTSTDIDGGTPVYSIIGGDDQARFGISSTTGALTFVSSRDFETPADLNNDNIYSVIVQVSDGNGATDTQTINVRVINVNEAPVIGSNGAGATANVSILENSTAVTTVNSTDVDGGSPVYSIVGGADQARFTIVGATGVLAFAAAPNFEMPIDANSDNVYVVTIQVSDGLGGIDTQTISVTVTNVNEAPVITSNGGGATATFDVAENTTAVTTVTSTDVDGGTPVYTIIGGSDQGRFSISSTTGALTFVSSRDFETPADLNNDNIYSVIVQVSDGNGATDTQTINVRVINVNEAPVIGSNGAGATANVSILENSTAVTTVSSTDVDGGTPIYSIIGGVDQGRFTIGGASGVLTFTTAPDFEQPVDANTDNVYVVTVQVSDGLGGIDTQTISVTVTNVNEAPVITSNGGAATAAFDVAENTTAVTTVTSTDVDGGTPVYTIIGGDDQARFNISSTTGALTFVSARDFETPADLNNDNIYSVIVQVSDGNGATDTQTINVRVININEAPISTVIPDVLIAEDAGQQTLNTAGSFSDPDAGDVLTWSVRQTSGVSGFFQNLSIGPATGLLSFQTGLNVNGTVQLEITVLDAGNLSTTRSILVTATPVDDVPVASSASFTGFAGNLLNVAAPGLAGSVQEVDGDPLTFTITRQPDHGTLVLTSGGGFEYRPNTGYTGTDTFEYVASDGITLSNPAVVQLLIQPAPSQSGSSSSTAATGSSAASSSGTGAGSGGSAATSEAGSSASTSGQTGSTGPAVAPVNAATPNLSGAAGTQAVSEDESDDVIAMAESLPTEFLWGKTADSTTETTVHIDRLSADSDLRVLSSNEISDYSSRQIIVGTALSDPLIGNRQQWIARHDAIFRELDTFEKDLNRNVGLERQLVGSVGAVTTGLSVGYIIWIVRGGMLLSGLLAQMPAWQMLDPLLVIDDPGKDRDDDGETIGSIVENHHREPAGDRQREPSVRSAEVSAATATVSDLQN